MWTAGLLLGQSLSWDSPDFSPTKAKHEKFLKNTEAKKSLNNAFKDSYSGIVAEQQLGKGSGGLAVIA